MVKKPIVFLDMDGVLCDFMARLHIYLRLDYGIYGDDYPYPKDTFLGVYNYMDVDPRQIKHVQRTEHFWGFMPWMPDGREILAGVRDVVSDDRVVILTHPPVEFPYAYAGKVQWIKRNIPELSNQIIPTGVAKGELFADSTRILIDDWTKNTDSFTEAGGSVILIPRPWNRLHLEFNKQIDMRSLVRDNLIKWMDQL